MCAIHGLVNFNFPDKIQIDQIKAMTTTSTHRGPDFSGIYFEPGIALGHNRLSIIDLSSAANQPFKSQDGRYVLVYNGEIYNFDTLKQQLDYHFTTQSDTEVLLAAFIKWGKECLVHLRGMFAFTIWDSLKKELFVARDRMGVKPLYYYQDKDVFVFSSELRSLISSGCVPPKTTVGRITNYLRFQSNYAPETILKDVWQLMPGHFMTWNAESSTLKHTQYWEMEKDGTNEVSNFKEAAVKVKKLVQNAVEERMVSDVPMACFLSGGIDSSIIVSQMAQASSTSVNTFSLVFQDKQFDEREHSLLVAKKYKTHHQEILLQPSDFLNEIPNALSAYDHPSGDGMNTFMIAKYTRERGIKMALSGLGGDELFGGYHYFTSAKKVHQIAQLKNYLPKKLTNKLLLSIAEAVPKINVRKFLEIMQQDRVNDLSYAYLNRKVWLEQNLTKMIEKPSPQLATLLKPVGSYTGSNMMQLYSLAEMDGYMQNVLLNDTDQMSMAHGLEVRTPFIAHDLVNYVLALPDHLKQGNPTKKLLIEAFKAELPESVYLRKKMGFNLPWPEWLRNELYELSNVAIHNFAERDFINSDFLLSLWNNFLNDKPSTTWSRFWLIVVLENWLETNKITIVAE